MSAQNIFYPPKKGDYSQTEVQQMVKVIFDNGLAIRKAEGKISDEIFKAMAMATGGKRATDQVQRWFYNMKKVLEHEHRFTRIVENSLSEEERQKLFGIMFPNRQIMEVLPQTGLHYPSCPPQEDDEETGKENSAQPSPSYSDANGPGDLSPEIKKVGCFNIFKKQKKSHK